MSIQNENDLIALRRIGKIVATCLKHMGSQLEPGITTLELDEIGRRFLELHGATSAPKLTYGFPGHTCISVNEEAAHGLPGATVLNAGDLVNIDVSAELGGYFADTGGSFIIPPESQLKRRLCDVAFKAMNRGVREARAGAKLNLIGKAMESEAERHGFTVIENLGSHGVGRALHEEPKFIPGYYDRNDRRVLKHGQVITVEPFVSSGAFEVFDKGDGWTLMTESGVFTAQYEHTIVVTDREPLIMTLIA
ncbi:MAG: type I methionyl aminopeptidase [Bdellovibrionaceae bacterium]|nr:type I methionyl aminopeptidase [Pseudobdellovibrionaceae bacterium]